MQFRVLAGLVEVEGHVIKPGPAYLELFSPAISSLLLLSSLNPVITRDAEFDPFLEPLRHPPVILYSSREAGGDRRRGLGLDLDKLEIQQLNTVIRSRGWTFDVAAIAVIEELKSYVVQALIHAPKLPPVFTVSDVCLSVCLSVCLHSWSISNLRVIAPSCQTSNLLVQM